jgi:hypothetical protein
MSPNPRVVYKLRTYQKMKKYLQLFRAGAVGTVINMRKVQFQYVTCPTVLNLYKIRLIFPYMFPTMHCNSLLDPVVT